MLSLQADIVDVSATRRFPMTGTCWRCPTGHWRSSTCLRQIQATTLAVLRTDMALMR